MDLIIDSSVIISLLLEHSDRYKKIKEIFNKEVQIYISNLTMVEVYNALRFEIKDQQKIRSCINLIESLDLKVLNLTNKILDRSLQIAFEVNDTIYDASYHTMAIINGLTFITCDKKYYNKANHLGFIQLI